MIISNRVGGGCFWLRISTLATLLILLTTSSTLASADDLDGSVLMQAMADELNRNMTSLQIEHQLKPYYISYRATDEEVVFVKAEFGGLVSNQRHRNRDLYVDLRVGDYSLDNSNFICQTSGSSYIESDRTNLPLEDNYDAIRNSIWLVTDGTYKKALETFSRKKAVIENQPRKDEVPDFSRPAVCREVEQPETIDIDQASWVEKIVQLSGIFKKFPKIYESNVTLRTNTNNQYFLDTEGNRNRRADIKTCTEIFAKARSEDGDPIEDYISFCNSGPDDLSDIAIMTKAIEAMAETLSLQTTLEKEEGYSGPVLLTGQAAAELFFQVLGKGSSDPRKPLFENEVLAKTAKSDLGDLVGRIGRKVMPDFLSAYDDPNLTEWGKTSLFGHFSIDDQGVQAQRVELIKDGKMTGLLMGRSPTKKFADTNGHGRFRNETYGFRVYGMPGVLVIESKESNTMDELKSRLINICKDYGNSYGLIITRLAATRPRDAAERYMQYYASATGAGKPILSSPSVAYKVDVETGKVELIRGLDFSSITLRILRDIVAVNQDKYVYNFMYRDDNGNEYPMSVMAPSVLIEEVDMATTETKTTKAPVLRHPYFK